VKRLLRIILLSTALLALLFAGGVWYLSRWLEAPETHALVERELSKALKMPLTFHGLHLSVWGGARADAVYIQDGGTRLFESNSFVAKHRILPLFSRRFVFSEVSIESPRFILVQRPDGSWKLPQTAEGAKPQKTPEEKAAAKAAATPKPKDADSRVLIEKLFVKNGQAEFYDNDQAPVASASGLHITLKDISGQTVEGRVRAERIVWNGYFGLTDFSAGVSNSKQKGLIIPEFVAKAGGGTITGGYARKPEKPAKYSAKIKLDGVDLGRAIADGEVPLPNVTGQLSGNVELRGTGDDTKLLNGKATITFTNGSCREIEMINDIGAIFQMKDVAEFGIPEAKAEITIWEGRLNVKPLTISAPPLGLTATGTAKLDGKLRLNAQLLADAKLIANRSALEPQFSPPDANGLRAVPFEIEGTLTKPKHNLLERLTGTKDKRIQKAIAIDAALSTIAEGQAPPPAAKPRPPAGSPSPVRP
jgi:type II secretion system protein N